MTNTDVLKRLVRARMASTGETYQQALAAIRADVPPHHLHAPDGDICVGRCRSTFLAAADAGHDGGSMVDCAHCPGAVCLECGRAAVEEAFGRCLPCNQGVDRMARNQRLAQRCGGRACISGDQLGDTGDFAFTICGACDEAICHDCGQQPVEHPATLCDICNAHSPYEGVWDERDDRRRQLQRLEYLAGLVVKLGGGTYREVYRALGWTLGPGWRDSASYDDLHRATTYAEEWAFRLRTGGRPSRPLQGE
ncbi:hypothetical protein ACH4T9_19140 [Micromonospora sp. NPDC020750]|uniref:hypothetical protein n=1 Tax=unclassified Micromonospora TaxID=2617518 RepID=UPI0037B3CEB8